MTKDIESSTSLGVFELSGENIRAVRVVGASTNAVRIGKFVSSAGEQTQVLDLVVFAANAAVFGDGGAVVVAATQEGSRQPSPVRATVDHVEVQDCNALSNVVAVVEIDKLGSSAFGTSSCWAQPGAHSSSLKLGHEGGLVRGDKLEVIVVVGHGKW